MQMKQASENVDMLLAKQKKLEDRIVLMREAIRDLVSHMYHSHFDADAARGAGSVRPRRNTTSVGLFETDEEADKKRELVRLVNHSVCLSLGLSACLSVCMSVTFITVDNVKILFCRTITDTIL